MRQLIVIASILVLSNPAWGQRFGGAAPPGVEPPIEQPQEAEPDKAERAPSAIPSAVPVATPTPTPTPTATATICFDSCGTNNAWAGDGACDDGGPGSTHNICTFGYDCTDCGSRVDPTPAPPPLAAAPAPTTLCFNSCGDGNAWVGDGDCDDGGPGSDYALCTYGYDCIDCGPRSASGGADVPPQTYPRSTLCFNSCGQGNAWVGDGDCDDGGPGSDYALCTYGYDCIDCGSRPAR
jgi:hypothetical protein